MNLNGYLCYSFFYHHHLSYTRKESKRKTMTIRHNSSFLSHILVCHKLKVAFESSIHRHGQTAWTGLSTKNRLVLCRQQAGVCVKPRERERHKHTHTHSHPHRDLLCTPQSQSQSHSAEHTHTDKKKKRVAAAWISHTKEKKKPQTVDLSLSLSFFLSSDSLVWGVWVQTSCSFAPNCGHYLFILVSVLSRDVCGPLMTFNIFVLHSCS